MAFIKEIRFAHVGRNAGCLCDRCGQYIQNIVTVDFSDGTTVNFGQDCFKKLQETSRLNDYGKKLLRKTLKNIEFYSMELVKYTSGELTAENDERWKAYAYPVNDGCYWNVHHDDYEAFRRWMIDEWFPERFKECQKQIDRFAKVNFKL